MQNEVKLKYTVITHKEQYSGLFLEKNIFSLIKMIQCQLNAKLLLFREHTNQRH